LSVTKNSAAGSEDGPERPNETQVNRKAIELQNSRMHARPPQQCLVLFPTYEWDSRCSQNQSSLLRKRSNRSRCRKLCPSCSLHFPCNFTIVVQSRQDRVRKKLTKMSANVKAMVPSTLSGKKYGASLIITAANASEFTSTSLPSSPKFTVNIRTKYMKHRFVY
jgi:hypothetical protein